MAQHWLLSEKAVYSSTVLQDSRFRLTEQHPWEGQPRKDGIGTTQELFMLSFIAFQSVLGNCAKTNDWESKGECSSESEEREQSST